MSLVLTKVPVIYVSVCVVPFSFPMHLALLKFPFISAEVRPFHYTSALQLVFNKLANIHFPTICEIIFAMAVKLALVKITIVS